MPILTSMALLAILLAIGGYAAGAWRSRIRERELTSILTERNDGKFESYRLQIARALVQEKAAKAGKNLKKYLQTLADRYKVSYLENAYRDTSLAGVYEP